MTTEYTQQFSDDFQRIQDLQDIFDGAQGNKNRLLSYNPVLERWKFESLQESEIDNFILHEVKQVETALRERLQTKKSVINYHIDEDLSLRNELLPDEPFTTVLMRGIAYRKENGSTETERENAELEGFLKIQKVLLNETAPLGSKMIVISGPGIVEKTAYPHNFIDIYEKAKNDEGEVVIKMTRGVSDLDYSEYMNKALLFDLNYFDSFTGPIDAWFLSHPIPTNDKNIFENIFDISGKMEESEFQRILTQCMPLIVNYINVLCEEKFKPNEVKRAFNAILNKADFCQKFKDLSAIPVFVSILQEVKWFGSQPVIEKDAGCGESSGFSTIDDFNNSVAQFGKKKDKFGSLKFKCPHCRKVNTRPYGRLISKCKYCSGDVSC